MANPPSLSLTPERFAQGMTYEQYLEFIGTAENLRREGSGGAARRDLTGWLRERTARTRLSDAQAAAMRALAARPDGPANVLMLAEEWSSDCRRDLPVVKHLADAGGLELRIFTRDGDTNGVAPTPNPDAPNADLMRPFLRQQDGETFLSIPVVAFFTRDFQLLYHYLEFPSIYRKDRIREHQRVARPDETADQAQKRAAEEYAAMLASPLFDVWAEAAAAEMISLLHERLVVGSLE